MIKKTIFIFFLGFAIQNVAFAAQDAPRLIACKVKGVVKVQREGALIPIENNSKLQVLDKVITSADGQVDVIANELWGIRLLPDSEVVLDEVQVSRAQLSFNKGSVFFKILPLKTLNEKFEIKLNKNSILLRGAQFWGYVNPQNVLSSGTFAVKEGTIEFQLPELGIPITLNDGQAIDLPVGFSFPSVRNVSEKEKTDLNQLDEIPLLLMKANIGDQLELLKNLDRLASKADKSKNPAKY